MLLDIIVGGFCLVAIAMHHAAVCGVDGHYNEKSVYIIKLNAANEQHYSD